MRFRLLGPVEIQGNDGECIRLNRRMERLALAVLLLEPGRPVSTDRMIDLLWGDTPPGGARGAVHSIVSRIRGALRDAGADAEVVSHGPGYLLRVAPDTVDLHQFLALVEEARSVREPELKSALLGTALGLWRGPALADAATGSARDELCGRLDEARFAALCDRIDADLAAGRHADLIPELADLVAEYPLRERLHGQLMLALYRCGRRADALDAYRKARQVLVTELGLEPGAELRALEAAVIAGAVLGAATVPRPAQLPPDLAGFVGRAGHLRRMDQETAAVQIVSGTAGVGKTALAVRWAHRVRHQFPDGQLYVDLHGFAPSGPPVPPAQAVRWFLDALDVPARMIPNNLAALTALYRTRLADRRVLILLDNARDAEQVRPLLPGSTSCRVVVTSRNTLSGLIATVGAQPVQLDPLSTGEAREMLTRRLGPVATEADQVIARCAQLPLALAVVAARVATTPRLSLADVAAELSGLDAFELSGREDPATRVRAVFSSSLRALGSDAARLFRLHGLHCGPSMTAAAAASLAGIPPREVVPQLAELTGAHLVTEPAPGRYGQHDLLSEYARELLADDPPAIRRMLDHYLHTAYRAALLLEPGREPITLAPPAPGVTVTAVGDAPRAIAWFRAERQVLLTAIPYACARGLGTHAWQLAWTLTTYFNRQGGWDDLITALAGLSGTGGEHVQRLLGLAHAHLGRIAEAESHLRQALDLAVDHIGRANMLHSLAWLLGRESRTHEALDHAQRALDIYRKEQHRTGEARMLNAVGWLLTELGDYPQAIETCSQALALLEEAGDRPGLANTWDTLGYARHRLGDLPAAMACYERALGLFRGDGDRFHEADTLHHLGDTLRAAGRDEEARETWRGALAILEGIGHTDAKELRVKLAGSYA